MARRPIPGNDNRWKASASTAAAPPTTRASTASICGAAAGAGAPRQARLQCQIHHRNRRGDRLARSAPVLRAQAGRTEGRCFSPPTGRGFRRTRPTIFLGCRGGIEFDLDAKLRHGAHHSGNWGGVLANPATILPAPSPLVDGSGRMRLDGTEAAADSGPVARRWPTSRSSRRPRTARVGELGRGGAVGRRAALALEHAGGTGDVVTGNPAARRMRFRRSACGAAASLRRRHQRSRGHRADVAGASASTTISRWSRSARRARALHASRTDFDQPWVRLGGGKSGAPPERRPRCCRISAARCPTTCSPRGLACRRSGCRILPGCSQHAPNEHMLAPLAREGLAIMTQISGTWERRRRTFTDDHRAGSAGAPHSRGFCGAARFVVAKYAKFAPYRKEGTMANYAT